MRAIRVTSVMIFKDDTYSTINGFAQQLALICIIYHPYFGQQGFKELQNNHGPNVI